MSYSITVTPLENEGNPKGIANIHIGRKLSATVFINENEDGKLFVQRPGYETKKKDENGKPIWNTYLGMKGEGSITKLNEAVLKEYDKMVIGGERSKIEEQELKIEVISVTPRRSDKNKYERGLASINVNDEFILNSIKVLEGKYGLYISFPSYYDRDTDKEYKYVEAIADVKKEIDKQVVVAYEKKIEQKPEFNKDKSESIQGDFMNIPDTVEEKNKDVRKEKKSKKEAAR